MWNVLIQTVLPKVAAVVDSIVSNKADAEKLKAQIQLELLSNSADEMRTAASIIKAEAQGESWLQRNWRPLLMLSIVAIVVNNYLLYPYLVLFGAPATVLELPPELFNLMTVGVGGYVVGRSAEKAIINYRGGEK